MKRVVLLRDRRTGKPKKGNAVSSDDRNARGSKATDYFLGSYRSPTMQCGGSQHRPAGKFR